MANRYWQNGGRVWAPHAAPVLVDCNFVVDSTNVNGFGISSLKGPGIAAVYGHTSATPASGNPNPAAGLFKIEFQDDYYKQYTLLSGSVVTKLSGSSILVASAGVTAGLTYVITVLGTTTTAGWQSLGLPVGITPAVGVSFIATATATATGTGAVQVPHANGSGAWYFEQIGTPGLTLSSTGIGAANPYVIVRAMSPTNSSTTTPIATNPADTSIVSLAFYMSNSSVQVAGE